MNFMQTKKYQKTAKQALKTSRASLAVMLVAAFALTVTPDATAYAGVWDNVITNIRNSASGFPDIYKVFCYLFGLMFAISAILKFKQHVDSPNSESLRAPIVRLIIGGALFSFPVVMTAMIQTIGETGPSTGAPDTLQDGSAAIGLGGLIDNFTMSFQSPQRLFSLIAYLFGVGFGLWAATEFVKTADSPGNNPIRKPIMITLTASCLLAAPAIVRALQGTLAVSIAAFGYDGKGLGQVNAGMALDQILARVVTNLHGPLLDLLSHVSIIAGLAFMFVGIFRLTKGAQDGPQAPWGRGTIGTFLLASALLSLPSMMGASQTSLFGKHIVSTYAVLADSSSMDAMIAARANQAIQAVFMFVQIVGWFSFVRGLFILRSNAEGNGQASMSAGFTHIIGGAIAVNLTALVNAVQQTLGLIGLTF